MEQQICIYRIQKEPNTACLWKMFYIIMMTMEREGKLKWRWWLLLICSNLILCLNLKKEDQLLRSSHQRFPTKKGVLRNFAKFTGKHLCQCLFFNKVAGLSPDHPIVYPIPTLIPSALFPALSLMPRE